MKVMLKCHCGEEYQAREADIKRGWAKTCSKSCAAIKRVKCKPNATYPDGSKVDFGKRLKRKSKPKRSYKSQKLQQERNFHYWSSLYESGDCTYEVYLLKVDDEYLSKQEQLDKIDAYYEAILHPCSGEALGQW